MRLVTVALAICAFVAIVIFAVQNVAAIDVSFLFWSASISKVLVIIGSYLLGMVSGWGLVEVMKRAIQN
jgi:uncharacterized integral membrane protein